MKYWNKRLTEMTEYIPGEQPVNFDEYIKLNTNESPFPPSQAVLDAIKKACNESLRLYPNPTAMPVREIFAKQNNLGVESVFVSNGSDEIFTLLFRGFIEMNGMAAFPYPSYSLYYTLSEANGIPYERIKLTKSLDVDFPAFLKKKYNLVIISNPNNPTGKGCNVNDIREFLKKFKGLLVIDEAYVDFYSETAMELAQEFNNVIVTRSFSKSYSLAGLRVGIAVANPEIIHGFIKLKDSYNVDRLAQAGAVAALLDRKSFKYSTGMVVNNKEYLEEKLGQLGFDIVPSKANFLFVKHPNMESNELFERLKEKKILVRFFKGDIQSEYIRISIGSMMDLKKLVTELALMVKP